MGSAVATSSWKGGLTGPVSAVTAASSKERAGYGSVQTPRSARPGAGTVAGPHPWEAHERAHGGAAMVARRHPVPDLRPLLAGQRRRRVRRPAGGHIRARLTGVARRGGP